MKLTDLIDLEAQLAWDGESDAARLGARDAAIARRLGPDDRADPQRAVRAWLGELRDARPTRAFPGRPVARALRVVSAILLAAGFLFGWALATSLLAYDGTRPINVMDFLWVVVGVQLVLLVLLLAAVLVPGALSRAPLVGEARALVAWLYPRVARRLGGEESEAWAAAFHRLRSRRSLYAPIEPWILLGLTQLFGLAFNLGVLLALLRLVVLTDLSFSWATTLDLEAAELHRVVSALSLPWAWALPEAVPTLSLVEASRYSRQAGAYLGPGGAAAVGGWWPFLMAATVTYGLLPRAIVFVVARVQRARALAAVRLDDVETRRLLARLMAPSVETRGVGAEPEPLPIQGAAPLPSLAFDAPCVVVLFRDVPVADAQLAAAVRARLGCEVAAKVVAGGVNLEADRRAVAAAAEAAAPVLVVAEAFEPPDKSLLRLLRELRASIAPRRPVVVGLVGVATSDGWSAPSALDAQVWRERVSSLEDPFLGVEPLEPAS